MNIFIFNVPAISEHICNDKTKKAKIIKIIKYDEKNEKLMKKKNNKKNKTLKKQVDKTHNKN